MIWRFTIIQGSRETVIDEPPGWDTISKTIKRDPEYHGVFFNFSESSLQFIEEAYWIIKEEKILRGVDGDIGLRIEWTCDECDDDYQLFYQGKLDFSKYVENCGSDCSISIGLEASEVEVLINNRLEAAVDLTSNKAYDGSTLLTDYIGLKKELAIPGKSIKLASKAINEKVLTSVNFAADLTQWHNTVTGGQGNQMLAAISPGFSRVVTADIDETNFYSEAQFYNGSRNNRPDTGQYPTINFKKIAENLPCIAGEAVIKYRLKGKVTAVGGIQGSGLLKLFKLPVGLDPNNAANYQMLEDYALGPVNTPFDRSNQITVSITEGDRFWFHIFLNVNPTTTTTYILREEPECYFSVEVPSMCEPSTAKVFMLHEAASRVVENITNNGYRFRSTYYGRTDSQPYSYAQDGCGSLRTLTNGLQLRRAALQDNTEPKVFLSLKDLYESLSAIDCVGLGIEGTDVRVEPIKFFYQDDIVFVADGVDAITSSVRNELIWNQFNFGYDKYETESTNGLDAIHTKRQYRLQIKNSNGKFEKYSKIMADGYAIEETRRKFGTSNDWRYDQNIFMLCLKRIGSALVVDQNNIASPDNMYDPATVLNFAITPIRNAMRWFKWIVQGIKSVPPKLFFSSGEGNYVAKGMLTTGCVVENRVMSENETLQPAYFEDDTEPVPFIEPDKDTFRFPVGLNEFVSIAAKKYGKVQYRRFDTDPWKFGWIDTLKYTPEEGQAEFSLIICKE